MTDDRWTTLVDLQTSAEFFMISRLSTGQPHADLTREEAGAVLLLGITGVEWIAGSGTYERREDAYAVMAKLAPMEPSSWFRVISSNDL